jgi:hypothetical protein
MQTMSENSKLEEVRSILCVGIILIFMAHATITDNSEPG